MLTASELGLAEWVQFQELFYKYYNYLYILAVVADTVTCSFISEETLDTPKWGRIFKDLLP